MGECGFLDYFLNFLVFIGFAFVYMEDERDAEYAIRRLDRTEFGRKGRRLRVEWTKVCDNGCLPCNYYYFLNC